MAVVAFMAEDSAEDTDRHRAEECTIRLTEVCLAAGITDRLAEAFSAECTGDRRCLCIAVAVAEAAADAL